MDTPTCRILDTISSNLGDSLSINQLTEKIKKRYGTAYYANIYEKLQDLKKEGLLNLDSIGRSSIIRLNLQNDLLTDFFAEIEIAKKIDFLKDKADMANLLAEMEDHLDDISSIKSISYINPERNIKLNRIELLFLLGKTSHYHDETISIYEEIKKLQEKHNIRIDSLILDEKDFTDLIKSSEINSLREALAEKTTFHCPQAFWSEIRRISRETEIKTIKTETIPANISDLDLTYNLNRFGYKEFGSILQQGIPFCIEHLTTALLLKGNARQLEAIPIILSKNSFKSNLLAFLSQKYGTAGRLLGLLKILQHLRPTNEVEATIELLKTFKIEEVPANEETILQKMRLYNAT